MSDYIARRESNSCRTPAERSSSTSTRSRSPTAGSSPAIAIVVAVGGHAGRLPIPGAELALTYEDIRNLTELPGWSASSAGRTPAANWRRSWSTSARMSPCWNSPTGSNPAPIIDVSARLTAAFECRGSGVTGTGGDDSSAARRVRGPLRSATASTRASRRTRFLRRRLAGQRRTARRRRARPRGRARLSWSTTDWSATSPTSSPPATSTGSACWSAARARAWSPPRTP